ncbi:MAG: hypothetical protein JXA60_06525 [Candidatus Coatesbacteria bacterium]|nr:hypothetical protein [Candidatus Coatesbacteria bacterium]
MKYLLLLSLILLITGCGQIKRKYRNLVEDTSDNKKEIKQTDIKNPKIPIPQIKASKTSKVLDAKVKKAVEDYALHIDAIWTLIEENSNDGVKAIAAYQKYYDEHSKELEDIGKILIPLRNSEYSNEIRNLYLKKTQKSQNIVIKLLRNPSTRARFKETIDYTQKLKLDFVKIN